MVDNAQRTMFFGDNLSNLRILDDEIADLIYLDPPYNSKRVYNINFGSEAQVKAFDDNWRWDQDQNHWLDEIKQSHKALWAYIDALLKMFPRGHGLPAYITAMAIRAIELHRVLKKTGSIYVHVDPTASHYLKIVLDQIFGTSSFRNEIVWHYQSGGRQKKQFSKKHDTILFYSKSNNWFFDPDAIGEKRGTQKRNNMKRGFDEDGRGYWSIKSNGKIYKYYDDEVITPSDVWIDISHLQQKDPERLGYPTQKPLRLLERIILGSSKKGDLILDPYMGSGTTIEACELHGRNWIGMDVTHHSVACTASRLEYRCGLKSDDFEVIGVPADKESAHHLKENDKSQFAAWAVLSVHAIPQQYKEKTIYGIRRFSDLKNGKLHSDYIVYVVCEGDLPAEIDINNAQAIMRAQKASLCYLIGFDDPSDKSSLLLASQGVHTHGNGRKETPVMQYITVAQIIESPALAQDFFNAGGQHRRQDVSQTDLFE